MTNKNYIPWNKGLKGLQPWHNISGLHPRQKGYKLSEEHKRKISAANKISLLGHKPTQTKRGKDHWAWKGITPLRLRIRDLAEYTKWRKAIFERDHYTCIKCEAHNVYLHADHFPLSFAQILFTNKIQTIEDALNCHDLWDINNGRTLCRACHRKTDTWGKSYKNTATSANIN